MNILYPIIFICLVGILVICFLQKKPNESFVNTIEEITEQPENKIHEIDATPMLSEETTEQQKNKNEILDLNTIPIASEDSLDSGTCYRPITDTSLFTSKLDTMLIDKMSQVDDASEYLHIVNTMRKKYRDKLHETIMLINDTSDDITSSLTNVQTEFNKYGMEMLSKQYYDTIYKYGSFEEVKNRIILPQLKNNENNIGMNNNINSNNINSNNINGINGINGNNNTITA
jgi:hypothetical protein